MPEPGADEMTRFHGPFGIRAKSDFPGEESGEDVHLLRT